MDLVRELQYHIECCEDGRTSVGRLLLWEAREEIIRLRRKIDDMEKPGYVPPDNTWAERDIEKGNYW